MSKRTLREKTDVSEEVLIILTFLVKSNEEERAETEEEKAKTEETLLIILLTMTRGFPSRQKYGDESWLFHSH